ncbi:DUF6701 domain-containing protein [Vibrio sp. HN007]|uniref:DUF6701 domain-containing protein n=1 Tax=Vibrio iocasae TaxID=3098914 RepID=UPI0035D4FE91
MWIILIAIMSLLLAPLSYSAEISCSAINFSQDFTIAFEVEGENDDQFLNLKKNNNHIVYLWAAKEDDDSDLSQAYIFEENLQDDVNYQVRITNRKSGNQDFLTYNIRSISPTVSSWNTTQKTDSFSGSHDASGSNNDGLESGTLKCYDTVLELPDDNSGDLIPDICPYFPEPAQSWSSDSKLEAKSPKAGDSAYAYHIGGWSQDYQNIYLNGNNLKIGFNKVEGDAFKGPNKRNTCEVGTCKKNGQKATAPSEISPDYGDEDLTIGDWNYTQVCSAVGDSPQKACQYSSENGNVVITIQDNLEKLEIIFDDAIIHFKSAPGRYGRTIEEYIVKSSNNVSRFTESGVYSFEKFIHDTSGTIQTGSNIIWAVEESVELKSSMSFVSTLNPDDFVIFAPNEGSEVKIESAMLTDMYALVLADKIEFKDNFTLHGAVTSNEVKMETPYSTIVGESKCFNPSPTEDLYLEITEAKEFALLCENPEFTFTVRDAGNNNQVDTDYSGTIEVYLPSGISVNSVVKGSGSNGSYTPENGELILRLDASSYGTYTIEGELSTDPTKDDSSELYVAPYKFDSDTVYAIAGNNTSFSLKVLACDDGSATVVDDYDGSKTLTRSATTLEQPTSGQGGILGNLSVAGTTAQSVNVTFNDGSAFDVLNYDESGAISFMLSDPSFSCPIGFDCETDGGADWDALEGVVNVNARPWTFAICEPNNRDMTGTSSGGGGFIASGAQFSLNVLPIRYVSGATSGDIEVDNSHCSSSYVTRNFFNSSSPGATVKMLGALHTPSGGSAGNSVLVNTGFSKLNTEGSNEQYEFTGLSWDEVGSLEIGVSTESDYYGMTINRGYRNVGRFYPNHLSIEDHDWTYASGHNDFGYMEQAIGHRLVVEAINTAGGSVANYHLFSDSLIEDIQYYAVEGSNGLRGRISGVVNGKGATSDSILDTWGSSSDWELVTKPDNTEVSQLIIESDNFTFHKDTDSGATNYTTIQDGPYNGSNSSFGLEIIGSTSDAVSFSSDRSIPIAISVLGVPPNFRYGRMKLSDVGGNVDTNITVPLSTEYWTGTAFIENTDDSGSQLDADDFCRQTIWRDSAGTSSASFITAGTEQVSSGEYGDLQATHGGDSREQVRLWLRQQSILPDGLDTSDCSSGSTVNQPWLRYNWRGVGDEDPSAVIVFGIYRGNDRIIFRGENRLTGQ